MTQTARARGIMGAMTYPRLLAHADSACEPVHSLEAEAHALRPAVMRVQFTLRGRLNDIRIPSAGPPMRADGLWRHTCFEVFVRRQDAPEYLEWNLSPSGAWQACRFGGYRQGMTIAELAGPPHIRVAHHEGPHGSANSTAPADDALVLEAIVRLPAPYERAPQTLRVGLNAVVEQDTGALSYWALRHAPGRPDFHHPDAFALTLEWT